MAAGIQIAANDFIDVTVNAEYALGKNKWKTITFDARCARVSPEELEEAGNAVQGGQRGSILAFCRKILISTNGLKDFKGNSADVTERPDDDVTGPVSDAAHEEYSATLDAFMATLPLPIDTVTAYLSNTTKKGTRKN